ncbi:MAG TPA: diguanylate cyclase [Bryobacteraceae bacterium]|nr:diguanylate cyclase [Bryobacteraceae bacterium]
MASVSLAVSSASFWYSLTGAIHTGFGQALMLVLSACVYFVGNTIPLAVLASLVDRKPLIKTWRECYFWSFPYYLVGAASAGMLAIITRLAGWESGFLVFPILYWIHRSYCLYLNRLEEEKNQVQEIASLHLRTIEALALAIEAKDYNTYEHLRRVGIYAAEIGRELALTPSELQALKAASMLHDIGKLAVPEQIVSKPGRLSPAEFDKMKIHPLIGAEILERVDFPYPVVPIVRAHHERWDGAGYPMGLKGEEIPIGARILAAVDSFDSMISDRQYRRAMPPAQVIEYLVAQSGQSFDPKVVEVLARRHEELESIVQVEAARQSHRSMRRTLPEADSIPGLPERERASNSSNPDFLSHIAAARHEAQELFELTHELGNSLSLTETLSVLTLRLKRICSFDSVAIYVLRDRVLVPEYVNGENFQLLSSLRIPLGEGISGWVGQTRDPIVNGDPSVEPGYPAVNPKDPGRHALLKSALAVHLEGPHGVVGVLTLYAAQEDAFTSDHLRILSAVTGKIALTIENALKYQQAENSATTDALTSLPNARSLFLHLDSELARSKRHTSLLSVLVCDLDGFKEVNDRFGHLVGNRVLREVGQALKETCREYDYVARMGGDEFVVVLPGYPREAVEAKILQLTEVTRQAGRNVVGDSLLALSIGQASYPADGADAEDLLSQADRRMYKTKQEHKNRSSVEALRNLANQEAKEGPRASTFPSV